MGKALRCASLLTMASLTACGGAHVENPEPVKTHVVLPEAAATATAAHEPAGLVSIVPPKRVCELAGKNDVYSLAAWPGGRNLVFVRSSSTRMTIDEKGEAFVELMTPNFVVRGFASPAESRVRPAKWLSVGGVVFLTELASYPVVGTHDGKMTLEVYEPYFAFANPNDHLLDVHCDDVTLSHDPTEELRSTLPSQFVPGFGRTARFNFTDGISIAATFDGPSAGKTVSQPRASTKPRPPSYTTVLERRGTKVRIAGSYLAGWIDASLVSLVPATELAGQEKVAVAIEVRRSHPDLDAECRPDDREPDPVHPTTLVCPRAVRLVVVADESPDRLNVMGTIPAGRPVRVLERTGDLTSVFLDETPEIPGYPLATWDGVHVATPTVDLDGCTPTTAFPFPSPEPSPRVQYVGDTPDAILKMSDDAIPHLREEQAIQNVLENQSDFALCYDEGLRKNPDLWGEVVASFVITPMGKVTHVNELESTIPLRSEKIARCVLGGFASLRFAPPTSKTKTTTVTAYVRFQ